MLGKTECVIYVLECLIRRGTPEARALVTYINVKLCEFWIIVRICKISSNRGTILGDGSRERRLYDSRKFVILLMTLLDIIEEMDKNKHHC